MQKIKKNNKGFTLVELIVVIAILGVLAAVLAPQYIQYVEKSRVAVDKNTASAIEQAINTLCADGTITAAGTYSWDTNDGGVYTGNAGNTGTAASNITAITGAVGVAKSSVAKTAAVCVYTVSFTNGTPSVVATTVYSGWTA